MNTVARSRPRRTNSPGSVSTSRSAAANPATSSGATSRPASPTTSGRLVALPATSGTPRAIASMAGSPNPSYRVGYSTAAACRIAARNGTRSRFGSTTTAPSSLRHAPFVRQPTSSAGSRSTSIRSVRVPVLATISFSPASPSRRNARTPAGTFFRTRLNPVAAPTGLNTYRPQSARWSPPGHSSPANDVAAAIASGGSVRACHTTAVRAGSNGSSRHTRSRPSADTHTNTSSLVRATPARRRSAVAPKTCGNSRKPASWNTTACGHGGASMPT